MKKPIRQPSLAESARAERDVEAKLMRKYLLKGCTESLKECELLLGSDEALKHFGGMWGRYKADTMMMMTAIEYEFINGYDFTEAEHKVLRHVIGNISVFFKRCKKAHDTKVELQNLQQQRLEEERRAKQAKEGE